MDLSFTLAGLSDVVHNNFAISDGMFLQYVHASSRFDLVEI